MELNLSLAASPPSLTALHRGAALVVLEMCLTVARWAHFTTFHKWICKNMSNNR